MLFGTYIIQHSLLVYRAGLRTKANNESAFWSHSHAIDIIQKAVVSVSFLKENINLRLYCKLEIELNIVSSLFCCIILDCVDIFF